VASYPVLPAPNAPSAIISRPSNGGARAPTRQGIIEGIIGGVTGFVSGGVPGAIVGGLSGLSSGGGSEPASGEPTVPGTDIGRGRGRGGSYGGGFTGQTAQQCPEGTFAVGSQCVDIVPGGAHQGSGMIVSPGEGAVGQVGIGAVNPAIFQETVHRCPRGMVLGIDNLCYHKKALTKATRKWNPGRRPLLTGGELNAISRAARAARRVKGAQKNLEKLGLLKRPSRGRSRSSSSNKIRTLKEGTDFVVIDTD
jgi:hypothetical protein